MIDPAEEAIKRLISQAKAGAQRTQLAPRLTSDPTDPPVGLLWIRDDEQKAYLKTSEDTTLLVASAAPVAGDGSSTITDRSIEHVKLMLNTITSDELAPNSVTASELADGAVDGPAWSPLVTARSQVKITSPNTTGPTLLVGADFDHISDVLRVEFDGAQRFRVDKDHTSVGVDLPQSAMSVQTASTDTALRIRGAGGVILAEKTNGQRLFSVDGSGNAIFAGSISSLSGDSGNAGSLAIQGALTVTQQANLLSGLSVTGRTDLRAEVNIDGQTTFNAEPFFPASYSAKIGQAVHLRTVAANQNRLILEGVSALGSAEVQLGTGGPVLSGSISQNDRMFISGQRVLTSAPSGLIGSQIAYDTITGGTGAGVGNIAAETITGYNILNYSITSTELSPGAVVQGAIAAGAVGSVQLGDGSVIDRVVASLGVGKLVSGTLNADEVFMGPSGHIYLGPTFSNQINGARIQLDASGIKAYNSFNTPLAEFTPGGFALRTGVDGARLTFGATTGIELFGQSGARTGYLSPLGQFQLDSLIDGARMSLNSLEGVALYAGATNNLAYNPGFIGGTEAEAAVAGERTDDQRHVFAGDWSVKFRSTNPNINAPSYVDVPFKNTVGTGSNVTRARVNACPNPGLATVLTGFSGSAATSQVATRVAVLAFVNTWAAQVQATLAGAGFILAPKITVASGQQWTFSSSCRVSSAMAVTADLIWYDVNNAVISTVVSQPFTLKGNIVTQIGVTANAPSNATSAQLRVSASLQNTDTLQVSDVLYERAAGIDQYADGYTDGYQWDGTPGNSTSSLIPVPVLDSAQNLVSIFVWSDVAAWVQIEGRDSTNNLSRGTSVATRVLSNQWSRVQVSCTGIMDKVRLHYPSTDPARQTRITATPLWWSAVQVESGRTIASPFCSGAEPGCRWQGVAGKSMSIRDRDTVVTQISPSLGTTVSGAIVGGSLTAASFFAGKIFGTTITGGTIIGNVISGNQINGDQILANTINATAITSRSITADKIATGTLTATEISATSITGDRLVANTITATQIAARSITADRVVAGSLTATELAARSITSDRIVAGSLTATELASNSITAVKIAAGTITSDKFVTNMLLSSNIIAGASATSARVVLNGTGIEAYRSNGVKTLDFDNTTGNMFIAGQYKSGESGSRIEINPGGNNLDTIRLYPSNSSVYANITAVTAPADGSGAILVEGSASKKGRLGAYNSEAFTSYVSGGVSQAALSATDGGLALWATDIISMYHTTSGGSVTTSVLRFQNLSGNPTFLAPNDNVGLKFEGGQLSVVNGPGTSFGPIKATQFIPSSSETVKTDIAEITYSNGRTSWDIIEGAPAQDWKYTSEGTPLPPKPVDTDGNVLRVKQANPAIPDAVWRTLSDQDPNKWIFVDAEWPASVLRRVQRKHRFPLAEDLNLVSPDLVDGDETDPELMGVDLRDMVGVLWDAMDMMIKRERLLEQILAARLPLLNLPGRPQKGDLKAGIGALVQGRTKRDIDLLTGQIRTRIKAALAGQ
jgi:hypothetical protein